MMKKSLFPVFQKDNRSQAEGKRKEKKMSIEKKLFGKTADGNEAFLYKMTNKNGMSATVCDYGALLVSLEAPNADGELEDVVMGYDKLEQYFESPCFFGATIGRNGNRIAGGAFTINGQKYQMPQNENENNLHSGPDGYEKRMWEASINEDAPSVTFHIVSPDGDQGMPGNFDISVTYTLTEDNAIQIDYNGKSDKDTVANLTNHSYFNLSGHASGTAMNQTLWIKASSYNPVIDSKSIPTGEIAKVEGTPMDFTTEKEIGKDIDADFEQLKLTRGYDHNYVLDVTGDKVEKIAVLKSPEKKRTMEVYTDCVGVQFYSGNFIKENNQIGKGGVLYGERSAICLETQFYPNAINQENFVSPLLKAGEEYHTTTIYKFV